MYLDDILILNNSFSALEKERDTVIQILELAGFLINWEKLYSDLKNWIFGPND